MDNEEIAKRFATLETDMKHVSEFIKDIKENHLPHIYKRLSTHLHWTVTVVISILSSTVVGCIIWSIR